jgi:hypothetical protein
MMEVALRARGGSVGTLGLFLTRPPLYIVRICLLGVTVVTVVLYFRTHPNHPKSNIMAALRVLMPRSLIAYLCQSPFWCRWLQPEQRQTDLRATLGVDKTDAYVNVIGTVTRRATVLRAAGSVEELGALERDAQEYCWLQGWEDGNGASLSRYTVGSIREACAPVPNYGTAAGGLD